MRLNLLLAKKQQSLIITKIRDTFAHYSRLPLFNIHTGLISLLVHDGHRVAFSDTDVL